MQSSSHIVTTNKSTPNFLQAGCPSCCLTNSVGALKGNSLYRIIKRKGSHITDKLLATELIPVSQDCEQTGKKPATLMFAKWYQEPKLTLSWVILWWSFADKQSESHDGQSPTSVSLFGEATCNTQLNGSVKEPNISIYSFFCPSLNGVRFPMFCLLVEGECQILVL